MPPASRCGNPDQDAGAETDVRFHRSTVLKQRRLSPPRRTDLASCRCGHDGTKSTAAYCAGLYRAVKTSVSAVLTHAGMNNCAAASGRGSAW